ncbi:MAG: GIY-YIG nuclease family protein [Candidatus Omnitrophota bacterium]
MCKQYYFYILKCKDNSLYSGVTKDINARIIYHNKGKGSKFVRKRRPAELVYSEPHDSLSSARLRENEVKKWRREKREELIKAGFPRRVT